MISGIEPFYQRIADSMTAAIPDDWSVAEFHAIFHPDSSTYEAEYIRRPDGAAIGFQPTNDGARAIREIRRAFKQAAQPLWGQLLFTLQRDGQFNLQWGYEGCDTDGNLPFDEKAEAARAEERRVRLNSMRPRVT